MHRGDFDDTRACAADLISYLYGELNEDATTRFEQHLTSCVACREELASFSRVRDAIGEWRQMVSVPAMDRATVDVQRAPEWRRALQALRDFFALSPLWLKTSMVFASAVICALAALAITNAEISYSAQGLTLRTGILRAPVQSERPDRPSEPLYTREQVERIVAERVAQARAEALDRVAEEQAAAKVMEDVADEGVRTRAPNVPRRASTVRKTAPVQEQAIYARNDDAIPRLSDLLSEIND